MFDQAPPAKAMSKRVPAGKAVTKLADQINFLADEINSFYFPDTNEYSGGKLEEAKKDLVYSIHKMHESLVALMWSGPELPRPSEHTENWSMFYSYRRCYEAVQDMVAPLTRG